MATCTFVTALARQRPIALFPPTAAEASPPQRMCPHAYLSVHVYVAATRCELSRSVVFSSRALHMPRGACACVHRFGTLPPVSCQHLPSVVVRPSSVRPPSVRRGDVEVREEWKYFFLVDAPSSGTPMRHGPYQAVRLFLCMRPPFTLFLLGHEPLRRTLAHNEAGAALHRKESAGHRRILSSGWRKKNQSHGSTL